MSRYGCIHLYRDFFSLAVGSANSEKGEKTMDAKDQVADATKTIEIATQELQEILDYAQEAFAGTYLQTRDVLKCLQSATQTLKKTE